MIWICVRGARGALEPLFHDSALDQDRLRTFLPARASIPPFLLRRLRSVPTFRDSLADESTRLGRIDTSSQHKCFDETTDIGAIARKYGAAFAFHIPGSAAPCSTTFCGGDALLRRSRQLS